MTTVIRPITAAELEEYVRLDAYAFGYEVTAEVVERYQTHYQTDRMLAAFVNGRMTAHLVILRWDMAINGGRVAMGGIADVASWPEDRRQGHAAALLRAALERMRDERIGVSMLNPTFYALYQRYGWALAAERRRYRFRPADLRLLPRPPDGGSLERVAAFDQQTLASVYDQLLPEANSALVRDDPTWAGRRESKPPLQVILRRDRAGRPDGYILHRYPSRPANTMRPADQEFDVRELVATTAAAYHALIDYLARHDLASRLTWSAAPDDPLPSLLTDPAALEIATQPDFMLRVVEVAAAFERRGYLPGGPARLLLRVIDAAAPWNDGCWQIEVEAGRARVTATSEEPDLTVEAGTLAALYNGFLSPERARRAGMFEMESCPAVRDAVTRIFAVSHPPYCLDHF